MPTDGLIPLLRLVSPSLPIGAYAGSEGLEYAVDAGWIANEDDALAWIGGRLRHALSRLDVPLLARVQRAWQRDDRDEVLRWCRFLCACRESAELLAQDRSLGSSLLRLLADLDVAGAGWLREREDATFLAAFALAAVRWSIPLEHAAEGYLFAWSEAQVAAAIKLIPLGQTQGQRILGGLADCIPDCVARGLALDDDEIGFSETGVAIASSRHEHQYSRLFRS
jgi:urease accessory protein